MILLVHGPNLNLLGEREPAIYGSTTLDEIVSKVTARAGETGREVLAFQSNHEGALIDFLQKNRQRATGIIINGGALTHYGLALRDCLAAFSVPIIEVHISNIYRREAFRQSSVTAPVATGLITGLGWRGYLAALDVLIGLQEEHAP